MKSRSSRAASAGHALRAGASPLRLRRRRLFWLPVGVLAATHAVFALALSAFVPALVAFTIAFVLYGATTARFIEQMRDQPRRRWITRFVDLPLFAHFGSSLFAFLGSPLCLAIAALGRAIWPHGAGGVYGAVGGLFGAWRAALVVAYLVGFALSFWAIWIERHFVRVRRIDVHIAGLPAEFDGYTIAQLSDLHVGSFDPKERALEWAALSNALQPDLAVVTGDLVTSGTGFYTDAADAIAALRAKDGVFVSMGNHDQAHNDQLSRLIEERGPTVLRNASRVLRRASAELVIAGLDGRIGAAEDVMRVVRQCAIATDAAMNGDAKAKGNGAEAGVAAGGAAGRADVRRSAPMVLLSHYPRTFKAAAQAGADLVLTGHTHGGQLGVPFLSQRLNLATMTGQLSRGLYFSGKAAMYVNAGLGTTGPPMRLGVPPEIALITLRGGAVEARVSV